MKPTITLPPIAASTARHLDAAAAATSEFSTAESVAAIRPIWAGHPVASIALFGTDHEARCASPRAARERVLFWVEAYSPGRSYQIRPSFNVIWAIRRRLAVTALPSLSRNWKLP